MSDINLKIRHAKRQHSQNLDCSNLKLEYLPNEIFQLKNLITLNLSNNNLKELDKQLENLVNLKELNFENNQIEELPKEILSLTNLTNLNLKNNPVLLKLKDYDIYWKLSLKNYFSENAQKLNFIKTDYSQTETSFFNKNINPKNSFINNTTTNSATPANNNNNNKNPENNFSYSSSTNDSKLNISTFSKPTDFKNISFANININSNIPISTSSNPNINSLNNSQQQNTGLLTNLNSSSKKQILKEGEVLYKLNKNSLKNFEEFDEVNNNNSNQNKVYEETQNENNINFNSNFQRNQKENLNNSTMNKTVSNFNFSNQNSIGNNDSNNQKEKEIGSSSNNFNKLFGKNLNSLNNTNFQKISPISVKAEILETDNNRNFQRNFRNSETKNSSTEKTNNITNISQNSNENITNNSGYAFENKKTNNIEELERKLKEKDLLINELKLKNLELETKINSLNNNLNSSASSSFKSNSFKFNANPVEDEISQKRNWMDNNTSILGGPGGNLDNSIFISNINSSDKTIEDVKELESKLQKEIMNNKRMKNQIEKLSQQIASMQNNFNTNSEDLLKKIKEISYEHIEIKNQIGQGGFSIIYKGIYLNIPVAVKVLFDPNVNEDLLNEFNNEIKMLFLLRHPNIISLLGTSRNGQKLVIVTEFLENGSLFEFLHKQGKDPNFTNKLKIKIIKQILNAMLYLHSNDIVHRDLKSHNILLDESYNIKLCDFGLAKPKTDLNSGSSKFSGTPAYMAPEIIKKKSYDEKVDVFAFGTLVWEIMTRKIPHEGVEMEDLKQRILNDEKLFIPKTVPKEIALVIDACRSLEPNKRPSFLEVSKMPLE